MRSGNKKVPVMRRVFFGGFKRSDVIDYVEKVHNELAKKKAEAKDLSVELARLKTENLNLSKKLDDYEEKDRSDELSLRLHTAETESENEELKAEIERLRNAFWEKDAVSPVLSDSDKKEETKETEEVKATEPVSPASDKEEKDEKEKNKNVNEAERDGAATEKGKIYALISKFLGTK
ncbi:MAG: hypothetical protein K6F09_00795 [Clostridiales bacterium]|nr:hypothetical protein [Clostridiales bacterium]